MFCPTPSTQHNATVATGSVRGTLSPGHDSSTRSGVWRDGVGSRLGKLAERLVASESLAEKLTGQVPPTRVCFKATKHCPDAHAHVPCVVPGDGAAVTDAGVRRQFETGRGRVAPGSH